MRAAAARTWTSAARTPSAVASADEAATTCPGRSTVTARGKSASSAKQEPGRKYTQLSNHFIAEPSINVRINHTKTALDQMNLKEK